MSLNLATLVPAKIGTSEIATKSNITTAINSYDPAGVINAGTTTINGGNITTGTITANHLTSNSVTTGKIALGTGIVNGYIQSSDFTTVGEAGFRLKSDAASTYEDPDIYGAYIRGGVLDGAVMSTGTLDINNIVFANSQYNINNTGPGSIAKYYTISGGVNSLQTDTFYSPLYGTSYLATRVVAKKRIFMLDFTAINSTSSSPTDCYLDVSVDGGTWQNISYISIYNTVSPRSNIFLYENNTFSSTVVFRITKTSNIYTSVELRISLNNIM